MQAIARPSAIARVNAAARHDRIATLKHGDAHAARRAGAAIKRAAPMTFRLSTMDSLNLSRPR